MKTTFETYLDLLNDDSYNLIDELDSYRRELIADHVNYETAISFAAFALRIETPEKIAEFVKELELDQVKGNRLDYQLLQMGKAFNGIPADL